MLHREIIVVYLIIMWNTYIHCVNKTQSTFNIIKQMMHKLPLCFKMLSPFDFLSQGSPFGSSTNNSTAASILIPGCQKGYSGNGKRGMKTGNNGPEQIGRQVRRSISTTASLSDCKWHHNLFSKFVPAAWRTPSTRSCFEDGASLIQVPGSLRS
jgi:hypothetical protein